MVNNIIVDFSKFGYGKDVDVKFQVHVYLNFDVDVWKPCLTLQVVNNIIVDFSNIALDAHTSARCKSSFKSYNENK